MRRVTWVLLLAIALIGGCGGNQPPLAPSQRPTLRALPQPGVAYIAIIGDVYTSGSSSGGKGPTGWPAIVAKLLHTEGVEISTTIGARSGSGYGQHSNTVGSARFIDQVNQVVGVNDRLVILFGSSSDQTTAPDNLATSAQRTFERVQKKAPDAKVLVIGPAWMQNPSAEMLQARDIIKLQAEAVGATFIDPFAEGWFNDRSDLIGADGRYPNDAGHALMAEKIAPLIAQQLKEQPTP